MTELTLACPDLGDFKTVAVIEILVKPGDHVEIDTPLITLETDKATMDVPAAAAGEIVELLVQKGSQVSKGTPILRMRTEAAQKSEAAPEISSAAAPAATIAPAAKAATPATEGASTAPTSSVQAADEPVATHTTQLLVLGAGPGGYTAAFRAADLGLSVTLVERWEQLGGVCLNVGCIPSKALLHAAKVVEEVHEMREHGIVFGAPQLDFDRLRAWKNSVVRKLTGGLAALARQRRVQVVRGTGRFLSPHVLQVSGPQEGAQGPEVQTIRFEHCIIAAGSESARLPFLPQDPRIIDSTGALELPPSPGHMLVIGGGIIGLEMACVFEALGAKIDVVELTGQLIPGCDADLVKPLDKRIRARYGQILLDTRVTAVTATPEGLKVDFQGKQSSSQVYDYVLVAVGRVPNGRQIDAQRAGVHVDERGFIPTDKQMRTNVPHIFAIGDIVGQPMLAHKATHEGKVAAEVIAGHKSYFDARVIPAVAYTDPEVAWVGVTENQAKAQQIAFERSAFPWAASGRSLSLGRDEGLTKLLFDPVTHRVIGGGIVGPSAGELIAEVALAIEMGADAADVGLTIHAHPTLSETVAFAAEAQEGTLTDLYLPKRR